MDQNFNSLRTWRNSSFAEHLVNAVVLPPEIRAAMPRQLIWINAQNFQGFGCSECTWAFHSASALVGKSLDEMKQSYEDERDQAFELRSCAQYSISAKTKD